MTKIFEQKINRFDGGMANDIREKDTTRFAFTRNFDTLSFPHRLIPYRSYENGNDTNTRLLTDFVYASSKLHALGINLASSNEPKVYIRTAFTDGAWTTEAANFTSGGTDDKVPGCFVFHDGSIFMLSGTTTVDRYYVGGGTAWAVAAAIAHGGGIDGVGSNAVQGIVHSKDKSLYLAGTRKIYRRAEGAADSSWSTAVLTLPLNLTITSICEYGNFLAIGCKDNNPIAQTSKVFLWDRDSSVTTLSELIDWGLGTLNVLEELEGKLIGISLIKRETSGGLIFNSVLSFKYYNGNGAQEFERINGTRSSSTSPISYLGTQKQKVNNRLYFVAMLSTDVSTQTKEGVWSVGRSGPSRPYVVTNEYPSRNDNTGVPTTIEGFFIMGSYVWVVYDTGNVSKTDDTANFTSNSKYETQIFDGDDSSITKKLIGVTVNTAPLPAAGSVQLLYRIDANIDGTTAGGNMTSIFTHTTDNSLSHSAINIESSGATLPEFKEIQFQIISLGGAEIIGLSFAYEITGKRLYDL